MTNTKNPMTQFDYTTFTRMLMTNPTEAEAYRQRVTGEDKLVKKEPIGEAGKTITEQTQDILNSETVTRDQVQKKPQVIDMDKVRQALKDKGVKGVNLIKNEKTLMEKARANNIL